MIYIEYEAHAVNESLNFTYYIIVVNSLYLYNTFHPTVSQKTLHMQRTLNTLMVSCSSTVTQLHRTVTLQNSSEQEVKNNILTS